MSTGMTSGGQICRTFNATAAIAQFDIVELDTSNSGYVKIADTLGTNTEMIGVAQNAALAAGDSVNVCLCGITKVKAGESLAVGNYISTGNSGLAMLCDSSYHILGRVLEVPAGTVASGDVITAFVNATGGIKA
jgi:hypothetical protein